MIAKNGESPQTEFEANYKAAANAPIQNKTSLAIPKVAIYEPEGSFHSYVSHNFCDKTTWYQESSRVEDETLVQMPPPDGLTFNFANQNIIDVEHGKLTGESNYTLDFATMLYRPTIRDTYGVQIKVGGNLVTTGYTIDYAAGTVTFDSAPGGAVSATYSYAGSSKWKIEPSGPGRLCQIRHIEIQFTEDFAFNTPIVQEISVFNPLSPPNKICVEHIVFQNPYDVINIGNEGKGQIVKYGGLPTNINVFPFQYGRTIDLKESQGAEISVEAEGDIPLTGSFLTVSCYTTEEDEP